MTTAQRYKPPLASETLLAVLPGQPPFLGCGVSSAWHGAALATLGESTLLATGKVKGRAALTSDLKRGWAGFTKVSDSNGIPDQGDYLRIHRAMFPGLPEPQLFNTRSWPAIVAQLDDDKAISIAVRLSAVRGTKAARFTTADHQMVIWKHSGGKTKRIDPMHPHSTTYSGDWIDLDDVRKAAKAISGGLILSWLYPVGGWTAERLMASRKNARIKQIDAALDSMTTNRDTLREKLDDSRAELQAAKLTIDSLEQQLEDCNGGGDCDEALKAQREAIADYVAEAIRSGDAE